MAVAFDAVGPSSAGQSLAITVSSSSTSWSHTCTGSNRILIVGIAIGAGLNDGTTALACTYNSVSMTSLGLVHNNAPDHIGFVQMFGLIAPATGANTVLATWTGADTNSGSFNAGSLSFTGCDQVTGWGTAQTASGQSHTSSVAVTAATGDMVTSIAGAGSAFSSSNQTVRWMANLSGASGGGNGIGDTAAGAASVTMSQNVSSLDDWGIVAVQIKQAAGAAASIPDINMAVQRN